MQAQELHLHLEDYAIIDVRDDDYDGRHIKGAMNVPHHDIVIGTKATREKIQAFAQDKPIVVHCMLSQVRGPSSVKYLKSMTENAVHVLQGGFKQYSEAYPEDIVQ